MAARMEQAWMTSLLQTVKIFLLNRITHKAPPLGVSTSAIITRWTKEVSAKHYAKATAAMENYVQFFTVVFICLCL